MLTRSLRKSLIYLESVSHRDDIVIILRVSQGSKSSTYHCTPSQALNRLFCSSVKFKWMQVS